MCAEFIIRGQVRKALRRDGLPLTSINEDEVLNERIRLFGSAPIVTARGGEWKLESMGFSLKPKGVPYPTFNARIESWDEKRGRLIRIYDKPTWRKPFLESRCLIPMNAFVEPIYIGENAGRMVQFQEDNGQLLLAAGLFEESVDKKTGEIYTGFAIIMDEPTDFILQAGHHRQPLLLSAGASQEWLTSHRLKHEEAFNFLKSHRHSPNLKIETDRQMAKGWEKRVEQYRKKAERELQFSKNKNSLG